MYKFEEQIMGLFRANNIVANFWVLFATLSAYVVVTLKLDWEILLRVVLLY